MADQTIVLVGVPDTGKTNFLARLWKALSSGNGALVCPAPPDNIEYVEASLGHVLQGSFAPRSNKNIGESRSDVRFTVGVEGIAGSPTTDVLVPDVTGELWKHAIETLEMPAQWMEDFQKASGAMLFVRVHSDEIVEPLDWITAQGILRGSLILPKERAGVPTQVQLCELMRFLELSLKPHPDGSPPRVAIIVTAYDLLSQEEAALGPLNYLAEQYPLFAGRIRDANGIYIRAFGASIVGGDLSIDEDFKRQFLDGDLSAFGYVVEEQNESIRKSADLTRPLAWVVRGDS